MLHLGVPMHAYTTGKSTKVKRARLTQAPPGGIYAVDNLIYAVLLKSYDIEIKTDNSKYG